MKKINTLLFASVIALAIGGSVFAGLMESLQLRILEDGHPSEFDEEGMVAALESRESPWVRNKDGQLPIHILVASHASNACLMIRKLMEYVPIDQRESLRQ